MADLAGGPGPDLAGGDAPELEGWESPERSIWPAIYPELLRQVREHNSTIIFVNNRRAAERVALRLNELAAAQDGHDPTGEARQEIARAHHGSLAREERTKVEELLEGGPAAVPGGDQLAGARDRHGRRRPGAADRVAEVGGARPAADRPRRPRRRRAQRGTDLPEVPRRPARERGGRTAHARGADRGDGRAAQRARRARPADRRDRGGRARARGGDDGAEQRRHGRRSTSCTRWYGAPTPTRSSRASCWRTCSTCSTGATPRRSSASCARGSCGTASPARSGRAGAPASSRSPTPARSPTAGCTRSRCPDGRRVGELDEEMVYEARAGQTFLLGASSWRIEEIGRDRVIVTPAPGVPGAVPFWKGDTVGREKELGAAIGAFSRWAVDQDAETLQREYDLDERAARNLIEYLREQQQATRVLPSERTIVLERFRDEIGDWRLCVLSPYGGRVHAAWALALSARMHEQLRRRGRRDRGRRRDRAAPARPRRGRRRVAALRGRAAAAGPGGGRAGRHRRARRLGAVRGPLPRERLPRAADPARVSRAAARRCGSSA